MIKIHEKIGLDELKEAFATDRERTVHEVYTCFRKSFIRFARRFTKDEDLIIDGFQEAVIAIFENLTLGKITEHKSSFKTYFFTIGRNKILNMSRNYPQHNPLDAVRYNVETKHQNLFTEYGHELEVAFEKLGDSCKSLLIRFYYERYSINAIMHDLNYKNENTVKAHKSRCMKKLREVFQQLQEKI